MTMKLRLEATPEELRTRSVDLVLELARQLSAFDPRLGPGGAGSGSGLGAGGVGGSGGAGARGAGRAGGVLLFVDKSLAPFAAVGGPDRNVVTGSGGINIAFHAPRPESADHPGDLREALELRVETMEPRIVRDRRTYDSLTRDPVDPRPFELVTYDIDSGADENREALEDRVERRHTELAPTRVIPREESPT